MGWTRDVNKAEIPLKIRFNVFDVKSPLLSTSKLRKHGYSVVLDQQQTIQKNGTTIALTDQNGLPTLELRLASRAGEVDEKMCAPVEETGEEARRATPMNVPRGPSDAGRRAHEIHHMPYRSWCEYCVRGRGIQSPHLRRDEQARVSSHSGWQNTWQLKEKRQPLSDRPRRKNSQSNAYTERAHQSVEAMVKTMKEVIEDKAKTKQSATEDITTWMIRHAAFLQTSQRVHEPTSTIWISC